MTKTLSQKIKRRQSKQSIKIDLPANASTRGIPPRGTRVAPNSVVFAPVAQTKVLGGSIARVGKNRAVPVSHRELLCTISNSTNFIVNGGVGGNIYRLNPMNTSLFSWLPQLASNFDQYVFQNVWLEYNPLCANTEVGRVALWYDKDSQDPEPADRVELANYKHVAESSPWTPCTLDLPCDSIKRFCQDTNVIDSKLVDAGQVGFAVHSGAGTNPVGEVFIHYTVTLYEPQSSATMLQTIQTGTGAVNSGPLYSVIDNNGSTFRSLLFRSPGVYFVSAAIRGTAFSNFNGSTVVISSSTVQLGISAIMAMAIVVCSSPGQILGINGTALGNTNFEVIRAKLSNNANLP